MDRRILATRISILSAGLLALHACLPGGLSTVKPNRATTTTNVRKTLSSKLEVVAKANFISGQANLVSNNGGSIISNNGGALVSNNGGSILSNNGGGLIGNNGAGVVSNGGGNLVTNGGAQFRVQQAGRTIEAAPRDGETLKLRVNWMDGTRDQIFTKGETYQREVRFLQDGKPFFEAVRDNILLWPNGNFKQASVATLQLFTDGAFGFTHKENASFTQAGNLSKSTYSDAEYLNPTTGANVKIDALSFDTAEGKATFTINFKSLGLTESGVVTNLRAGVDGSVAISIFDPLEGFQGTSETKNAAGKVVYAKSQRLSSDGELIRTYDLQNGWSLGMAREGDRYKGFVFSEGASIGDVEELRRPGGEVVFQVKLTDGKKESFTIGFGPGGVVSQAAAPSPTSSGSPFPGDDGWYVTHHLGAFVAGWADGSSATPGAPLKDVKFHTPTDMVLDAASNTLYIADTGNHRIRKASFRPADGMPTTVETLAGTGTAGFTDGDAASATFNRPIGLALTPDGRLLVTDAGNHAVREIRLSDGTVRTLAGTGKAGYADGPGAEAQFNEPRGLDVTADGRVLVADSNNHRIRQIAADRTVSTRIGSGEKGHQDGAAAAAKLHSPVEVLMTQAGAMLVSELGGKRIRQVDAQGAVSTFAGDGNERHVDGPKATASFIFPNYMSMDDRGNLYVLDYRRVRVIGTDGEVRTQAGQGVGRGIDGPAKYASFQAPSGLAVDATGTWMAVTDAGTHGIKLVRLYQPGSRTTAGIRGGSW